MLSGRTLLLAGLGVALSAAAAHGTPPGANGRIVFERLRYQNEPLWGELFTANPDGTGARRLTHPMNGTEDANADWSPDGRRIAFERKPLDGAHSIWTIAADGSAPRRLTPACPAGAGIPRCAADDGWPAWSPDGRHIAFQRLTGPLRPQGASVEEAKAIYKDALVIADANGRHARTLVWLGPWRGDPQAPVWSPDGKRLVFVGKFMTSATNGTGCECNALYVVGGDGKGLRRITPPGVRPGGRPDWSPDGTTILFRTHPGNDPSGLGANLYTVHPDGTGLHRLTSFLPFERTGEATYSPDGTEIVLTTSHGATGVVLPDVFVMNADGTDMRAVTGTRNFEAAPDWGPG